MASSTFKAGDKVRYRSPCDAHPDFWGKRVRLLYIFGHGCRVELLDPVSEQQDMVVGYKYDSNLRNFEKCNGLLDI